MLFETFLSVKSEKIKKGSFAPQKKLAFPALCPCLIRNKQYQILCNPL